jgi:hypothetical protein
MKRGGILAAVFVAAFSILLTSASRAAIVLSIGIDTGSGPVQVAGPATDFVTASGSGGNYGSTFSNTAVTATSGPLPLLLTATSINAVSDQAGTEKIFFTAQNISNLAGVVGFFENLTANFTATAGATVTESTFVDTANGQFTTVIPVGSLKFITPVLGATASGTANTGTLPFSLTEEFDITATAPSQYFQLTANVSAVPEPGTWALMGVGFACLGFLAYRRKGGKVAFRFV